MVNTNSESADNGDTLSQRTSWHRLIVDIEFFDHVDRRNPGAIYLPGGRQTVANDTRQ